MRAKVCLTYFLVIDFSCCIAQYWILWQKIIEPFKRNISFLNHTTKKNKKKKQLCLNRLIKCLAWAYKN